MPLRQLAAAIDSMDDLVEDSPDASPALRQQVRLTKVYQLLMGDAALVARLPEWEVFEMQKRSLPNQWNRFRIESYLLLNILNYLLPIYHCTGSFQAHISPGNVRQIHHGHKTAV